MNLRPVSEKRQKLFDAKEKAPLQIGEHIYVLENAVSKFKSTEREGKKCSCTVYSLENDEIKVYVGNGKFKNHPIYSITENDIKGKYLIEIGENPFYNEETIRCIGFNFSSILFELGLTQQKTSLDEFKIREISIGYCNWNPFVYDKNSSKYYYQRDFVWTKKEKQLLVESIYQGIDCGKIVIRKRGWDELDKMLENGELELNWNDIIDGKQRLNAVVEFMECKFQDLNGNYFSDLSYEAQNKFTNHNLFSYAEMSENSKDEDVLKQFLKLNVCGVPQSVEHIEFVKNLYEKYN